MVARDTVGAPTDVGHAFLIPSGEATAELAVFVLASHREAGIGTAVVRALLAAGRRARLRRVWLVVERTNTPAVRLYRKVGFRTTASHGSQLEMERRLPAREDP